MHSYHYKMYRLNRLVGCYRVKKDPYGETVSERQGITLGYMYQIVATAVASAEATENLNALTVGMICVRNLQIPASGAISGPQSQKGRYTGRWCYGHPLWTEYPDIGMFFK